uniref:Crinkler effector protein N-terminal domain-containing protein n=1 Tax=Peronospora matthiolae TaxID=2874970 RepID=A0AAV1T394_9STRA
MVQVTLVCGIVGVRESVFSVGIDTTDWVDQLKDAIKAAKPAMIQSDARDLQLFLARRDGVDDAWMKKEEVQQGVLDTKGLRQLNFAAVPLSFNGLSERDVQTETTEAGQNSPVHVLVVLPPTLTKRQSVPLNVRGVIIHVTESMVLNDPPLVAYWHALATSSTAIVADTVVSLPNGTYILGNPALGSGIYIRSCFQELWLMFSGCVRVIGILGSPGVGKTYFAYSILLYLARRGETVVYESAAIEKCVLFSGNVVVQGTREDFDSILMQTETCYVVDGVRPKYCPAKTILLSSSRECIWRTVSDFGRMHRMPVWSEEEILNFRELMYSNTPVAIVEGCYCRWGGIPQVSRKAVSEGKKLPEGSGCEHGYASLDSPTCKLALGGFELPAANRSVTCLQKEVEDVSMGDTPFEVKAPIPDNRKTSETETAEKVGAEQRTQQLEKAKRINRCSSLIEETLITEGLSKSDVRKVFKQLAAKYDLQVISKYQAPVFVVATGNQSTKKGTGGQHTSHWKEPQQARAAWRSDPVIIQLQHDRDELVGKLKRVSREPSEVESLLKQVASFNLQIKEQKNRVRNAQNN